MRRIAIIEDDATIRGELSSFLHRNGFETVAPTSFDDVVGAVCAAESDLVLLDLNLPGVDGHYVCRSLRERSDVPVIVVTSRDTEMDELLSMNLGADDFIPKPYNPQILLARINAVLKRTGRDAAPPETLSYGGVTLDLARCTVAFCDKTAEVTKNELRILALLLRNPGTVVSRQRIQEELWQASEFVDDNTLSVNVSHLRRTLASIGASDYIRTRRGMGYIVE